MLYLVNRYLDKYKEVIEEDDDPWKRHLYFSTENEARKFIRGRAARALAAAEKTLRLAQQRVKKCEKKFAFLLIAERDKESQQEKS